MVKKLSKLHQRMQANQQRMQSSYHKPSPSRSVFADPPAIHSASDAKPAAEGATKRVYFMSRELAQRHRYEEGDVVISISDTGVAAPQFYREPSAVLALNFHDYVTPTEERQFKWRLSNMEDGEKIVDFVLKHTCAANVIVHCNYGQSRSKAVAYAISKETGREIWYPNSFNRFVKHEYTGDEGNGRLRDIVLCAFEERAEVG